VSGYVEINFDGLVGPTHNYAGLSLGNVASARNAGAASQPRKAALQGLDKMEALMRLGLVQGLLPPHPRPNLAFLRSAGFAGAAQHICAAAYRADPILYANACSASAMWTANAATVSPAADTADGRTHFTVANLVSNLHRALEAPVTLRSLETAFANRDRFAVHPALGGGLAFSDEGAANFMRLAPAHGAPGLELFVYGVDRGGRFPARQSRRAFEAIARLHGLSSKRTLFVEQADAAIQAGAFHNDVVAVANENVLFAHELAFADPVGLAGDVRAAFPEAHLLTVPDAQVSLESAIRSYLFNSQLVSLPGGGMALIAPSECQENPEVAAYLEALPALGTPIAAVHILDVRESMRNGGGPACLRLRVAVPEADVAAIDPRFLMTPDKLSALRAYIGQAYPAEARPDDLGDPAFHKTALDCLAGLLAVLDLADVYAEWLS
jgi:succinylarginine dihydrolase